MQTSSLLTHPLDISLGATFYKNELPVLIQRIKNDCGWKMGDLKSVVVANDHDKQVVLTAMHPLTEIDSVQKGEFTVLHVLEGSLKVMMYKNPTLLTSGQKFTIYEHTKYKIEALSQTFFLIIISPGIKVT